MQVILGLIHSTSS